MAKRINLKLGDKLSICGHKYELIENIGSGRGSQFRTYLVRKTSDSSEYVAKVTQDLKRALIELKILIFLNTMKYPTRYYARMIAFDHEIEVYRGYRKLRRKFTANLLTYLTQEKYQALDEYLKGRLAKTPGRSIKQKIADKLVRRVDTLHQLGIAHCDLRLANIMVTVNQDGRTGVRVIDFGSAKFGDDEAIKQDSNSVQKIIKKITA